MTRTSWLAATVLAALSLGGCGSSSPVQYYDLEALESGYVAERQPSRRVGVGPMRTPEYLGRSQIVTRGTDSEVVVDDFHRWIEPLGNRIHSVVAENLDSLLDDTVVVAFPYTHIADLEYQLVGRISRFDADPDGTAVLELQWGVIAGRDQFVVQPKRMRYEARAAQAGGYPALAHAMSEVLQLFSRDVAETLQQVMSEADD
jgi:uncharacterized lipoprotein YmbA